MVDFGLDMETNELRPCTNEGLCVELRFRKHEVRVEKKPGNFLSQLGDHLGPEGKIGNEVPVHDVQVQPRCARGGDLSGAICEPDMLPSEEGWSEKRWMRDKHDLVSLSKQCGGVQGDGVAA